MGGCERAKIVGWWEVGWGVCEPRIGVTVKNPQKCRGGGRVG